MTFEMSTFSALAKLGTSGYSSGVAIALIVVAISALVFGLKCCGKKKMNIKKYVNLLF